jgi:NTE family protein
MGLVTATGSGTRSRAWRVSPARARYSAADMTKPQEIAEMVDTTLELFGRLDILVNNAGIQHVSPIDQFPIDKWDAVIAIDLSSAFHTSRLALPAMRRQSRGRIINIASAHALVASPFKSAYVAAKHGIVGLTKVVALETAQDNITCNAICPGYVWTPLVEAQIEGQAKSHGIPREEVIRDVLLAQQSNKRFATVEEIGALPCSWRAMPPPRSPGPLCPSMAAGLPIEEDAMMKHVDPKSLKAEPARDTVKTVNLALQGGGAHGAFAWGVLDRLLEEDGLAFEGISATSAGAMNAAVLAYGMTLGGRTGAQQALRDFWRRVSHSAQFSPWQPSPWDRLMHNHGLENSLGFVLLDMLTRVMSPYQWNPANINPLRHVLESTVDFERLRHGSAVKLFLSATNVRTCKVRVFGSEEITADAVLASACLPFMFQAIEIDGEHYWDGGYMGNPAIFPLIYGCESPDVVIVHINPINRPDVPKTATDIMNRINEISFNSSLMREMRAIGFVSKLIDDGKLRDTGMKRMRIHAIDAEDVMQGLGVASKLNADWEFLLHLHDTGWRCAEAWLGSAYGEVGHKSTVDVHGKYL